MHRIKITHCKEEMYNVSLSIFASLYLCLSAKDTFVPRTAQLRSPQISLKAQQYTLPSYARDSGESPWYRASLFLPSHVLFPTTNLKSRNIAAKDQPRGQLIVCRWANIYTLRPFSPLVVHYRDRQGLLILSSIAIIYTLLNVAAEVAKEGGQGEEEEKKEEQEIRSRGCRIVGLSSFHLRGKDSSFLSFPKLCYDTGRLRRKWHRVPHLSFFFFFFEGDYCRTAFGLSLFISFLFELKYHPFRRVNFWLSVILP